MLRSPTSFYLIGVDPKPDFPAPSGRRWPKGPDEGSGEADDTEAARSLFLTSPNLFPAGEGLWQAGVRRQSDLFMGRIRPACRWSLDLDPAAHVVTRRSGSNRCRACRRHRPDSRARHDARRAVGNPRHCRRAERDRQSGPIGESGFGRCANPGGDGSRRCADRASPNVLPWGMHEPVMSKRADVRGTPVREIRLGPLRYRQ